MLHGFSYPLAPADLDHFCHPDPFSPFHRPFRMGPAIAAANGYIVILAHRGRWLDREFPAAAPEALERLQGFKFEVVPTIPESRWFSLEAAAAELRQRLAGHIPWLGLRCNATPVWKVGHVPVRASFLQLAARLPRAECAWLMDRGPLWLRFSGGMGAIARDERLTRWSRELWQDHIDFLTGEKVIPRAKRPPKPCFPMPGNPWPPPEPID